MFGSGRRHRSKGEPTVAGQKQSPRRVRGSSRPLSRYFSPYFAPFNRGGLARHLNGNNGVSASSPAECREKALEKLKEFFDNAAATASFLRGR